MKSIKRVEKYFQWAFTQGLLRFELDKNWLTVEYQENLGWVGADGTRWALLCAQDITEYKTPVELCNRITLMLAENLRSARQDVNGMMSDKKAGR